MTSAEQRRAEIVAARVAETGIDEAMVRRLVFAFYDRVRADPVLAPVFEARIADWEPHLERMCAFWSSVALMTGRYHGQPMRAHAPLPVSGAHFDRWLALFEATAGEVCPGPAARFFVAQARQIAASLELGVAAARGVVLPPGQRLESASAA
jgi:hemoglobin